MYLGGFAVECLLKAKLLEKHPWLANASPASNRSRADQRIWSLCYRLHDLEEIIGELPDLTKRLVELEMKGQARLLQSLQSICASWTIFARYSPMSAMMEEAAEFLERIEELKAWLR
jgi:hypothetical protein